MLAKTSALIGNTGFVGSNLASQYSFTDLYNSKNIERIQDKHFNLVVCAAAPGTKWLANKEPEKDLAAIERLIKNLRTIKTNKLVLVSTIDVYAPVNGVDEDTQPRPETLTAYGKHRLMLEDFISQHFDALIIRLPGIFGSGLKKNIIFDLLNGSYQPKNPESSFQFYFLNHTWKDIEKCLLNNLTKVNFATEPITVAELIGTVFNNPVPDSSESPFFYDMRTKHAGLWGNNKPYLYTKTQVIEDLRSFIKNYGQ